MADNVEADAGVGGAVFASDDIGGVHYPRTKVTWGPDGTANDTDNAAGKRLPVNIAESVSLAVTHAALTELAAAINASSQMDVNLAASNATVTVASHDVTNAGTFAVQAAAAGTIAHDSADSGNPVKVGAKASTALSGLTLVANADRTDLFAGVDGVLIVRQNSGLEDLVGGTAAITDGSSTSVIASSGAGVKTYITDVIISNSSATFVTVDIRDGVAGGVLATFPAPATSGCVHRLGSPLGGSAATAVAADPSAAASTITVSLRGFKSKI